jgi:hypothetical protein
MVDQDGLPLFPPLPARAATGLGTSSLLRTVQRLDTGALEVVVEALRAIVLFEGREVVDGYLEEAQGVLTGPDVLDRLDCAPAAAARLYDLPPPVLRNLPCYWRVPSQVTIGPSRWMDGGMLLRSFARPGQRGLVCIRVGEELRGLAFIEHDQVVGAYRTDGERVGGVEEVAALFDDPTVVLVGRLEEVLPEDAVQGEPSNGVLDEIERAIRAEIHDYADPAVAIFRSAPPTREGLLDAAGQVERMRIRMISAERMQAIAARAREIIG